MTVTADVLRRAETDEKWQIHSDQEVSGDIFCEEAKKEDLAELACFAEKQLSKLAEVYTVHDIAYFEQRMQEVECEGGSLILIRKEKEICGYFLALKKDREAWEIVVEDAVQKKAFPAVLHWFGESTHLLHSPKYGNNMPKVKTFRQSWDGSCIWSVLFAA